MAEVENALHIVGTDATTEQKRRATVVGIKNLPVGALFQRFHDKQEHIGHALELLVLLNVVGRDDGQRLDDAHASANVGFECPLQVLNHHAALVAVELHKVQLIVVHARDDALRHIVGKNTDASGLSKRLRGRL